MSGMDHVTVETGTPASAAASGTDTEQALARIWATVLNREAVGIHDDFLDLDGDSLSAMRCIYRIRAAFGVEVRLEAFFDQPADVAAIAAHVDSLRRAAGADIAAPGS